MGISIVNMFISIAGTELCSTKRPRAAVIQSRILKCQYKIHDVLGPEAKDLVRRMLRLDPDERASLPEIFNHCWLRPLNNCHHLDVFHSSATDKKDMEGNAKSRSTSVERAEVDKIQTPRAHSLGKFQGGGIQGSQGKSPLSGEGGLSPSKSMGDDASSETGTPPAMVRVISERMQRVNEEDEVVTEVVRVTNEVHERKMRKSLSFDTIEAVLTAQQVSKHFLK